MRRADVHDAWRRRSRRWSPPAATPIARRRATPSRGCAQRSSAGDGARRRTGPVDADRLARQHVGQAGHPARLQVRRHRRHVGRPRHVGRSSTRTRCRSSASTVESGVRVVPGGSTVRDGAYLGRGRHLHAADVHQHRRLGRRGHAGRFARAGGSCAQIGSRVHLSAAAQIGGVLEPVGALPVIIEDDVLVGGNCGVYEGAIVKRRAVLASGVILTGSTPIYDLPNERIIEPAPGQPLIVPEGAVVVPGSRPVTSGKGREWGSAGRDADHREVPRRAHGCADGARTMDSLDVARVRAGAHRHRFDDRPGGGRGDVAGRAPARPRLPVVEQPRRTRLRQRAGDARRAERRLLHALRLRAAVLSQPRRRRPADTAAAPAMRKGFLRRRWRRPNACGSAASAGSACCSSSAKSAAATARRRRTRSPTAADS